MSFFGQMFLLCLKERGKNVTGIVLFLLLLALTVTAVLLPGNGADTVVEVGLVLPEEGGEAIAALLQKGSQGIRYTVTDEQTAEKRILSGRWDCALVLAEDFEEKLARLDTYRLITVKTGPASTVHPLVREHAAACVMELMSEGIAREYLEANGIDASGLNQSFLELEAQVPRVQVRMQTLGGKSLRLPALKGETARYMLRGGAAVLLLLLTLYLAVDLGRWLQSGAARRLLALRPAGQLLLPRLCAGILPMLMWGIVLTAVAGGGVRGGLAWLLYGLTLMGISLLTARVPALWQAVPVCAPFLAVGCILLEPVLLDTGRLFPLLDKWGWWRPLTLYVKGCGGSARALGLLALEAALLLTLGLIPLRRGGKTQ